MTTLAQYKTRINAKLSLDSADTSLMTILTDYLNEGYEDVLVRTRCYERPATLALTAEEDDYSLPTQALLILGFRNGATGTSWNLQRVTVAEIRQMQAAPSSAPARYYASEGGRIIFYPDPGSESLVVDYIPRPTAMSAAGDTPSFIPSEHHKVLEWYGLREMSEFSERGTTEGSGKWAAMYEADCVRIRRYAILRGGRTLAPARLKRRRWVSSDPSRTS